MIQAANDVKTNKHLPMSGNSTEIHTGGGDYIGRDQINVVINHWGWEGAARKLQADPAQRSADAWREWNWREAAEHCCRNLLKDYSTIRVLGKPDPVPLEGIFTDVYILDRLTARLRYDMDELRQHGHDRDDLRRSPQDRIPGLDLVRKGQNLFLLGKPGAGKTTFLKYIALQAARGELRRTPIFVSLKEWSMARLDALMPFLVQQFAQCGLPDAEGFIDLLLNTGSVVVLFDGLDEVNQEDDERRRLTRLLQGFARKYRHSQCLITCRIAASEYQFEGFQDVEIADFTPSQVTTFARKWFAGQPEKGDKFLAELAKAEHEGLRELCSLPLLLAMLCLAFDESMSFPPRRAELYEDAVEALLRKWDTSRSIQRDEIYRGLSHKRKQQLLMHLAAQSFEEGEYFIPRRTLERRITEYLVRLPDAPPADEIDANIILRAMEAQHGLLVERAKDVYSFSHLTFQEYFTARYIVENEVRHTLLGLTNHVTEDRWREVFLLTASLLAEADDLISLMRSAIDRLVRGEAELVRLLTWAAAKAEQAQVPSVRRTAVRLAYIFLSLAFALYRALALALHRARSRALALDLKSALARARSHQRASAIDRTCARALEITVALDLYHTFESAFALDLDREGPLVLARKRTLTRELEFGDGVALDYALLYGWQSAAILGLLYDAKLRGHYVRDYAGYLAEIGTLSKSTSATGLAEQLGRLNVPSAGDFEQTWADFAAKLLNIMRQERDLGHDWQLTATQVDKLNAYFAANELLVQCLKLAVVSDRQAILDGLLLPPAGGR